MLTMQEDMLSQLSAEVEKLKLMLLAKSSRDGLDDFESNDVVHRQQQKYTSDTTSRMANTVKAQVPPVITKFRGPPRADQLHGDMVVKRQQEKNLIVPDEITEAKRQFKKR